VGGKFDQLTHISSESYGKWQHHWNQCINIGWGGGYIEGHNVKWILSHAYCTVFNQFKKFLN